MEADLPASPLLTPPKREEGPKKDDDFHLISYEYMVQNEEWMQLHNPKSSKRMSHQKRKENLKYKKLN